MNRTVTSDASSETRQPNSDTLTEAILIFQCQQCKAIVGDSSSWVCSDNILKTVTLEQVTDKIRVVDKLKTSTTCGSAYLPLYCLNCNDCMGRMYKTTTSSNDIMRDRFSLFATKICSYEVGNGSLKNCPPLEESKIPLVPRLKGQIEKMQSVIVSMNARISAIEHYIADLPN